MWMIAHLLAGLVSLQDPPPPIIEYRQPWSGDVHAEYHCGGRVRLHLRQVSGLGVQVGVRVVSYSGSAGEATAEELDRWNAELERLETLSTYSFACVGPHERVWIRGDHRREPRMTSVFAYWTEGQLRFLNDFDAIDRRRSDQGTSDR
jgi:hypothetical protein